MERAARLTLAASLAYLTYLVVAPFLPPLCWAVIIAIFAYPLHRRVQKRVSGQTRAALATTLLLAAILFTPVLAIAGGAAYESIGYARWFQQRLSQGHHPVLDWMEGKPLDLVAQHLPVDKAQVDEYLRSKFQAVIAFVASQAPRLLGIISTILMDLFIIFLAIFVLFRDGPEAFQFVKRILPLDEKQQERVFSTVASTIQASLFSTFVIAGAQGALGGLLFALLGLGRPLMWGVIMAFASLIPMVGCALIWAPAAVILAVNGHWIKAVIVVAVGVFVIGTADNILRPILMKGRSEMGELLVLISVIGGLAVFGMLGIVLGPLVVALALVSLDLYASARAPAES